MRFFPRLGARWAATRALLSAAFAGVGMSACSLVFPAPAPMRSVAEPFDTKHLSRCAIVFLPGFGDSAEAYADHGFIDALRARNLPVDTVSANATFGYYASRTIVDRLDRDVLLPLKAKGYEQIWMVGISMGGMGAVLTATRSQVPIAGLVLMAPYLGNDETLREIDRAGGIAKWQPPSPAPGDYQREAWAFLKRATEHPDSAPVIYLAAGDTDKLRFGHRLLAPAIPPQRVFRTTGGHDWGPWGVLWANFLDQSDFRDRCAPPTR